MATYEIVVDGKTVEVRHRSDAARATFEKVEIQAGQTKELRAEDGEVIATETCEIKETGPAEKQPKPKKKREHHNGDEVAIALHGLSIDQVGDLTNHLYEQACLLTRPAKREGKEPVHLLSESKRKRDAENIAKAVRRAKGEGEYANGGMNPGSGRMSLGLMIRKYIKMGLSLPTA